MNKLAIHAFDKAIRCSEALRSQEEAEACDACYDAGEWSGPTHARFYEEIMDRIAERVALRFGMTVTELSNQHRQWCEESIPWPMGRRMG